MRGAFLTPRSARSTALRLTGMLLTVVGPAHAQTAATLAALDAAAPAGRGLVITPRVSAGVTLTDNSQLTSNGKEGDLIGQASAGISAVSTGGRVRGFLDYSLTQVLYARGTGGSELQNSLNTAITAEAVENFAFVDFDGRISQQAASLFGPQSSDNSLANSNRVEVGRFRLSPYIRGLLGDVAAYEVRLAHTLTRASSSSESNNSVSEARATLNGASGLRAVSWSADVSHQSIDFSEGRKLKSDRIRGILSYAVTSQLKLSAIMGTESNNFISVETERKATPGWAIEWTPTERTRVTAQQERRFFGNSHAYSIEHRTPRTVWQFSDVRDVTTGFDQPGFRSLGTAYDLLFAQFASREPDPILRAVLVNNFLQTAGIPPNAVLLVGALASAAMVQRRQQVSFALIGVRQTLTFSAIQTEASRIDRVVSVVDDFSNANLVKQRGVSVDLSHRLTPLSSLNVNATWQRSTGTVDDRSATLRLLSITWTSKLSTRTGVSVGARHAVSTGTAPYTESAITATLSHQF